MLTILEDYENDLIQAKRYLIHKKFGEVDDYSKATNFCLKLNDINIPLSSGYTLNLRTDIDVFNHETRVTVNVGVFWSFSSARGFDEEKSRLSYHGLGEEEKEFVDEYASKLLRSLKGFNFKKDLDRYLKLSLFYFVRDLEKKNIKKDIISLATLVYNTNKRFIVRKKGRTATGRKRI